MRRTLICSLFALLTLFSTSFSADISKEFNFPPLDIMHEDEYDLVVIHGLEDFSNPGEPRLPFKSFNLILPAGETLTNVVIVDEEWVLAAENILPRPGSAFFPINEPDLYNSPILSTIYEGSEAFPSQTIDGIATDFYRGHGLGRFTVHPVRWNPSTKELHQLVYLSISIETQPDQSAENALKFLRNDKTTRDYVKSQTSNSEYLSSYGYSALDELNEIDTAMVIICDPAHESIWQTYSDFKTRMGLRTTVLGTDDIIRSYDGADLQEKIRNAIINHYNSGLEYVLLGGDVEFVPYREFFAEGFANMNATVPADIYFAGLDGNWNTDGDRLWGEAGEDDLYQEVSVGRACISTIEMAQSWIDKQISYQSEPVETEVNKALMIGEFLGWNVSGSDFKEEVRTGSSEHGYTTSGFPQSWDVETLYDSDAIWTDEELFTQLNSGPHYINHMGHCNVTTAMGIDSSMVNNENLTNNGINHNYYLLYTQGCLGGAFDQISIMEKWNNIENGAFAVVANSRSGWGSHYDTNGPSQRFDREFFDAIFSEDIFNLGHVNRDSKHDNIGVIDVTTVRYCYYELNLFGDPSVELYSDTIEPLQLNFPSSYVIGSNILTITSDSGIPFKVAVSKNNELFGIAESNADFVAEVALDVIEAGNLEVVVTAHNCVPIVEEIPIISNEDIFPIVRSLIIEDSSNPESANGQADFGEEFLMGVEVKNMGSEGINSLEIQLYSESTDLTIDTTLFQIGPLAPDGLDTLYLEASVDWNVSDLSRIDIRSEIRIEDEEWIQTKNIYAHAPHIIFEVVGINDEIDGDGDHRLDPGENASIIVQFANSGTSDLMDARLSFLENSDDISFIESDSFFLTLPSDSSIVSETTFQIVASDQCSNPQQVFFSMMLGIEETDCAIQQVGYLNVGGFFCDVETETEFQHYSLNETLDQWHIESSRNHTVNGGYSWKMGGEGYENYLDTTDCCLELPAFDMNEEMVLSFYHRMDAETITYSPGYCSDGGWIEISEDGETWVPLSMSGYNYLTAIEFPIGANSNVYSGSFDWTYESVVLNYSSNPLYLRFRFFSTVAANYEGWYIDDISISGNWGLAPPSAPNGEVTDQTLSLSWSTPEFLPENHQPNAYYVYRNNSVISSLLFEPFFEEDLSNLPYSTYNYSISAVYDEGQSNLSAPYVLNWEVSDVDISDVVPQDWKIDHPYPNPFNPSFSVRIHLRENTLLEAQLYNVLGKRVKKIESRSMSAGSHTLNFDNNNLSSGIYFLSVKAGPLARTFKVVMIK